MLVVSSLTLCASVTICHAALDIHALVEDKPVNIEDEPIINMGNKNIIKTAPWSNETIFLQRHISLKEVDNLSLEQPELPPNFSTKILLTPRHWRMHGVFDPVGLKLKVNILF